MGLEVSAFELDGYTKRSGLTSSDFTITLFKNGISDSTPVSISEIGISGEYRVNVTFTTDGFYSLQILIHFSKDIIFNDYAAGAGLASIMSQIDKIDLAPTLGPNVVVSGSLMDRIMNKNALKTYNQATDSLEAARDRIG